MSSYNITSLNDFIIRKQKDFPYARGELSSLLHHIGTAAKMVNAKIRRAGLVEIIGRSGEENPQGSSSRSSIAMLMRSLSMPLKRAVNAAVLPRRRTRGR